ncbi:MAG: autotransporter strand-loop-strand O-heptosyltransferase [Elusimicrobiaceae bacterium]|nr:autotransporter strand-loop-strand O-heptosyltransferase [Elusimicrobiaceae bacterium]
MSENNVNQTNQNNIQNTTEKLQTQSNVNNEQPQMGVLANQSAAQPVQDVTASVNTQKNVQQQNPFILQVPAIPTQTGPMGIRYDFNDGARVLLPKGKWHVQIEDAESDNIIFACDADEGWILSTKKYYIPFRIRVWIRGEQKPILDHEMNLAGKEVQIKFPVGTLGDIIGWLPYADRFQKKHNCVAELTMAKNLVEIFASQYPNLFFTAMPTDKPKFTAPYASYYLGLFFRGNDTHQPIDFRKVGLHRTAGYILGVDPREEAPKVKLGNERKIKERYVCIATKSSSQAKFWNNGYGWEQVVKYLKDMGYRVICIDKEPVYGQGFVWNRMPQGVEDFTGNLPLQERIALLEHADFFIGLSSGLSWLAWCAKVPIVLISGFTLPICEFYTPYRVFCAHGCNGCWDDVNVNFDHYDFLWCPKFKNTPRQFECTRLITGKQVIGHIKQLMKDYNLTEPNKDIKKNAAKKEQK